MSALISFSVDVTKLPKHKFTKGKNGGVYINLTASINDKVDNYGQNVSFYVNQTKEEREAKAKREYVGNGKVVWTDGNISTPEDSAPAVMENQANNSALDFDDEVPF